jgi:hypothetical protein
MPPQSAVPGMTSLAVATAVFLLVAACMSGWLLALRRFYARLQDHHPQVYEGLGSPSAFLRNSVAGRTATLRFLFAGRHLRLGDALLAGYGRAALTWLWLTVLTGAPAIVLACLFPPTSV